MYIIKPDIQYSEGKLLFLRADLNDAGETESGVDYPKYSMVLNSRRGAHHKTSNIRLDKIRETGRSLVIQ